MVAAAKAKKAGTKHKSGIRIVEGDEAPPSASATPIELRAEATAERVMKVVGIDEVFPSPLNPRKHFDPAKLQELAVSIGRQGIIQDIVTREGKKGGFEICAGERRWRAAKLAGLTRVSVRVITISDDELAELMLIENMQRDDLTPLEEARGYRNLIDTQPDKHSAESIAAKVGKSAKYVWDRMKLLDLVPEGQKLLDDGRITAGHGILIARLKPEDQARVIEPPDEDGFYSKQDGLWIEDRSRDDEFLTDEGMEASRKDPLHAFKACSVRELEHWIDRNVRFDPAQAAAAAPMLFEETALKVEEAQAEPGKGKKVVSITYEYRVPDGARDEAERTYGSEAWKRADGKPDLGGWRRDAHPAKTCDHSVLGVVVAGQGRGEAFDVCIAKDKCEVHWKKEIAERARRAEAKAKGGDSYKKEQDRWKAERKRDEERREQEQRVVAAFRKLTPDILKSVADSIAKAPLKTILERGMRLVEQRDYREAAGILKPDKTADGVLRTLIFATLVYETRQTWSYNEAGFTKACGEFGGGIGAIVKAAKAQGEAIVKAIAEDARAKSKVHAAGKGKRKSGKKVKAKKGAKR